jgi:outer membrane protein OmpA-like peptidoglycan-associated protein
MLNGARGELGRIAPPGLSAAMGVPAFGEMAHAATGPAAGTARDTGYREAVARETAGPGARRWIPWAVAAVVLLGALALFRTCRTTTEVNRTATTTAPATAPAPGATTGATAPNVSLRLPNGVQLNVPANSMANGLAVYLGDTRAAAPPHRFTFQNLQFPTNGATLGTVSNTTMDAVAQILKAYPNARVRIEGYTDNVGDSGANQVLSQQRASAVEQALVQRGIARDRIAAQGFGQQNPVATNDTEAGRSQNRRTDLVVVAK